MRPEHFTQLDERGFTVVAGVLPAETVARLLVAFGTDDEIADGGETDADDREGGTQHVDVDDSVAHAADWWALERHPWVLQLAGRPLPAPRFRVHGRNPRAGFGQQGLHTDAPPRRRGDPVAAVTAIWMLDAFTESNGATRVVPGTHLRVGQVPRSMAAPADRHPDEVVVTGAAGSVLVFNGHLWHSGTRNRSSGPRRAVQMTAHAPGVVQGFSRWG